MAREKLSTDTFEGVLRGVPSVPPADQRPPSAQWMDPDDILDNPAFDHDGTKLLLGVLDGKVVGVRDDRHAVLVAGSRAGKGRSVLIGNLLKYSGSVLAIDPKGELTSITARRRANGVRGEYSGLGQKVCVLDPFDKCASWINPFKKSFNPMSMLSPTSPTLIEDAGLISDAVVVTTGSEKDPHWDESARSLIETLILHVATYPKFDGQRDLVTVRELLSKGVRIKDRKGKVRTGEKGLKVQMLDNAELLEDLNPEAGLILEGGIADFFEKPANERGSVKSTARRHTKFLDFPALQKVLRETGPNESFDLRELKTAPSGMTIYLCLPTGRLATCNRWFRLFVNLVLEAMEREPTKPEVPVLLCLDEFAVLGHMQQIEAAAGHIAGFGVKLLTVIQDLSQLKAHYKDSWETFLGNAGIWQFFGNSDLTTLEFLQKRLGQTSLVKTARSRQSLDQEKAGGSGVSQSVETLDLITPEEASRLFGRDDPQLRQLVILGGEQPMIISRVYYDQHIYFKEQGRFGKMHDQFDKWGF